MFHRQCFLLGFFWKKATGNSALVAAISSAVLSLALKLLWPELPFIDRVGLVFLLCAAFAIIVTLISGAREQENAIDLKGVTFSTTTGFNIAGIGVVLILIALYASWW